MTEFLQQIFGSDWEHSLIIIFNLILIESLLSVDNAAVLATMVMDLPSAERQKALRYGIIGAYVFRGICLVFAAWLMKVWWLKPLGGIYLLYLAVQYFRKKSKAAKGVEEEVIEKKQSWYYKYTRGLVGPFWATVIAVEIMDLAFSLDNVFAAVAFTNNLYLICIGVFIGILAMRFVARWFVILLERYPFLETSAFVVIGILGLKLVGSLPYHLAGEPQEGWAAALESEHSDMLVSIITASAFFLPIISSRLFNFPARHEVHHDSPQEKKSPAKKTAKKQRVENTD